MPPTQCAIDDLRDGRLRVVEPIAELRFALDATSRPSAQR